DFIKLEGFIHSGRIFEKIYNWSMESPHIWDIFFRVSDNKLCQLYFKISFPVLYKEIYKIFDKEKPSLCITTHPYWNFIIDGYNRNKSEKMKYFSVITDSIQIHRTWVGSNPDMYIVTDEDTKNVIKSYKIPDDKILVTGFPVNPDFAKNIDRKKILSELGLFPENLTFLFVLGLGNLKNFLWMINYLNDKKPDKFQIVIITGKYKELYDLLSKKTYKIPAKVIGWTDKMAEFIKSSDLVISKGGGAIVMETLSAGKPIFIPVFTPGQERGNAKFILKNGFGFVENDIEKIKEKLDSIIANPEKLFEIQTLVAKYSKPFASQKIAEFIHQYIYDKP
ncbi:MAG: MGDG synthase family glycosyltransferase, partial [Endomicrobiia bacterium]